MIPFYRNLEVDPGFKKWSVHISCNLAGDDNDYVGLCAEFPSLSRLALTPESSLKGTRKLVADVVQDTNKNGEAIPDPIACRSYSGKFIVRVPPDVYSPELHAAEPPIFACVQGMTLN